MTSRLFKALHAPVAAVVVASTSYVPVAQAAMIPTDQVVRTALPAAQDATAARAQLAAFFAREDVRNEMQRLGVSPDEAAARVAALSDDEVRRITGRLDELAAGGGWVGTVIWVVVVVAVVLLITDLLCVTHVYPFTRCM